MRWSVKRICNKIIRNQHTYRENEKKEQGGACKAEGVLEGIVFFFAKAFLRGKNCVADKKEFTSTVRHLHLYVESFNALLKEYKKRKVLASRDKTFIPVGSTKHFPLTGEKSG